VSSVIKTVAIFTARADNADKVQDLLVHMAAASRTEPGNLRWDLWRDQTDPTRFVVDELYKDAAAGEAHRETPHYKKYASAVADIADRLVVRVDPIDIA
jgi:quinol monooxygenase YgiN